MDLRVVAYASGAAMVLAGVLVLEFELVAGGLLLGLVSATITGFRRVRS